MDDERNAATSKQLQRRGAVHNKPSIVFRQYTAAGITCKEAIIRDVVARVHLEQTNVDDFLPKKPNPEEPAGIDRKRKRQDSQTESPVIKRHRGRPPKILKEPIVPSTSTETTENQSKCETPVRRGRKPKSILEKIKESELNSASKLKAKAGLIVIKNRFKQFNGDKTPSTPTSGRVRKPNPKFQDFIVSPSIRHFAPSCPQLPTVEKMALLTKPKLTLKVSKEDETVTTRELSEVTISKPTLRSKLNDEAGAINNLVDVTISKPKLKSKSSKEDEVLATKKDLLDITLITIPKFSKEKDTKDQGPANKDPLEISTIPKPKPKENKTVAPPDPLEISVGEDVVRSFLPVFDESALENKTSVEKQQTSNLKRSIKEKENQINNRLQKLKSIAPKPEPEKIASPYSPPKLRSSRPSVQSPGSSPTRKVYINKYKTTESRQKESSTVGKRTESRLEQASIIDKLKDSLQVPKIGKTNQPQRKRTSLANKSDQLPKKRKIAPADGKPSTLEECFKPEKLTDDAQMPVASKQSNKALALPGVTKGKTRVNGSNNAKKSNINVRYVLVESVSPSRTKLSRSCDIDFNKLVRSLKSIKLPASNWKIRIVVTRQQTISEVTFTNKELVNERCIKFSKISTGYNVTFGKSTVKLLGAPPKISTFSDISILLDIVHNISITDPVLDYCIDSEV